MPNPVSCSRCVDLPKSRRSYFIFLFLIFSGSITLFALSKPLIGFMILVVFIILLISQIVGHTYYIGKDFNGEIHIHETKPFTIFIVESSTGVYRMQKTVNNNEHRKRISFDGPVLYLNMHGLKKTAGVLLSEGTVFTDLSLKWLKLEWRHVRILSSKSKVHCTRRICDSHTEAESSQRVVGTEDVSEELRIHFTQLLEFLKQKRRDQDHPRNNQRLEEILKQAMAKLPTIEEQPAEG